MSKALFSVMIITIICSAAYGQQADSLKVKKLIITTSAFDYIPGKLNAANFNIGAEKMVANNNFGLCQCGGDTFLWAYRRQLASAFYPKDFRIYISA